MLNQMRKRAKGLPAKILIGLLVVAFGIWGIAGYTGLQGTSFAEVGGTTITQQEFQRAYATQLRAYSAQLRRNLTAAEAQQIGLPNLVLSGVLRDALYDDAASEFGLSVGDDAIAQAIRDDPTFTGSTGAFSRVLFDRVLGNMEMNEDMYVESQREALAREMLIDGLIGGVSAPKPYLEAINRFENEERTIRWIALSEDSVGPIPDPTDEDLRTYFEANKADFRAPEYRAFDYVTLTPEAIADPGAISEDDVRAAYDGTNQFDQPERRRVTEIIFTDRAEADAALAELEQGTPITEVANARQRVAINLGLMSKDAIEDDAVAEAVFALEGPGATVVDGASGPVLVSVSEIEPAGREAFEDVRDEIAAELALERARRDAIELYDSIEDAFAGGATVGEVAGRFGLEATTVDAIDRSGRGSGGEVVPLPDEVSAALVQEVFESDVDVENAPIETNDAMVWYRVTSVTPPRDRELEEMRGDAIAAWTAQQIADRLNAKAEAVVARLNNGEPLKQIADELFVSVETRSFSRTTGRESNVPEPAVAAAFEGPKGHVASVVVPGTGRVVLVVDEVVAPAFFEEAANVQAAGEQLAGQLGTSLANDYLSMLERDRGVEVNAAAFEQIVNAPFSRF